MTKLTYSEASAVLYGDSEGGLTITPEQQSLAVQAIAVFLSPYNWSDYADYSDDIDAWVASTIAALTSLEVPPPMTGMNSEINCWAHEAEVLSGSALAIAVNTTQLHNVSCQQSPNALNNLLRWPRYLAAGEWSYSYLYLRNSGNGIVEGYVRAPSTTDIILWSGTDLRGSLLPNQFLRGNFTLDETGLYEVRVGVIGTSLGSNYANPFTLLQMWRTGP